MKSEKDNAEKYNVKAEKPVEEFEHLFYSEYSKNPDVRKVQELLREGKIEECFYGLGIEHEKVTQILDYLGYRENHLYDENVMEYEEWSEANDKNKDI